MISPRSVMMSPDEAALGDASVEAWSRSNACEPRCARPSTERRIRLPTRHRIMRDAMGVLADNIVEPTRARLAAESDNLRLNGPPSR
jgi:hypothetical protein